MGNVTTVTESTFPALQAAVAALPHSVVSAWTAIGPTRFVGGRYIQKLALLYQSQTYPFPPTYFRGQPSYIGNRNPV